MRGTKPHKTVWIAHQFCHHRNGWEERWIGGVYADRETAVEASIAFNEIRGPLKVSHWEFDGDCYIYDSDGKRLVIIQRHKVLVREAQTAGV
jgi:hypothetical protein